MASYARRPDRARRNRRRKVPYRLPTPFIGVEARPDPARGAFPQQAGGGNTFVVFKADNGIDAPDVQKTMTALFSKITADTGVVVVSPYSGEGAGQVSSSGAIALRSSNSPTSPKGRRVH